MDEQVQQNNIKLATHDFLLSGKARVFRRIGRMLHTYKAAYETEVGAPPISTWILALLVSQDGMTQNELMKKVHVDASMVTRSVKEMESKFEWIARARDETDNRLIRVYLTEQGRQKADEFARRAFDIEDRLLRRISDADLEALDRICDALEEAAKKET